MDSYNVLFYSWKFKMLIFSHYKFRLLLIVIMVNCHLLLDSGTLLSISCFTFL